jgi:hypothetical protein
LPVRTCFTCIPASKCPSRRDEGDAVAMLRVHVRLDLEHEAGEALVVGSTMPAVDLARTGGGASSRNS